MNFRGVLYWLIQEWKNPTRYNLMSDSSLSIKHECEVFTESSIMFKNHFYSKNPANFFGSNSKKLFTSKHASSRNDHFCPMKIWSKRH